MSVAASAVHPLLKQLGIANHPLVTAPDSANPSVVASMNPATGETIAAVRLQSTAELNSTIERSTEVFKAWKCLPAPQRGEIIRRIGNEFRRLKEPLGELVSLEMGKIRAEGLGEVQEAIDIADFAVGLSRQLYGNAMHSERGRHRMYEQWHPLGSIGIISAFNFPCAVWAWNAFVAAACGDTCIWKPSLMTPLVAIASNEIARRVMREQELFTPAGMDPADVFALIIGSDQEVGEPMIADRRLGLISATGSCRMGRRVAQVVGARLGRTLLELGGNNAIIVQPDADLDLVTRAVLFGAVGTAGQRCTTTRRLLVHESIVEEVITRLAKSYQSIPIGNPLDPKTLMGPLVDGRSVAAMRAAIEHALAQGCTLICGGTSGIDRHAGRPGFFVEPTILRVPRGQVPAITREETFAPILYVFTVASIDEAMAIQNGVDQGLSSAIFTDSVRAAEQFLSVSGSDCGIANVNIGTSGAEIGGAFGGEKDTGGGRESGSDSWKAYMRRQTCTINWGGELPLAQGIRFGE
ncbi:MAG: aldehyde dehydrogenase family protein [Phycisphaerales bacterium]|nr:aldehyde dehydrogenase family protein [Phycisphaerales bacterium]